MANDCAASLQICAIRVARLAADGSTPSGSTNMMVSSQAMRLGIRPVLETGDEFTVKDGCGGIALSYKALDSLKRLDIELELDAPDPEFAELLAAFALITDLRSASIGAAFPAVGPLLGYYGVSIEAWSKAWIGGGQAGLLPYWRWVLPKVLLSPQDRVLENGPAVTAYAGPAYENANFGNGPNNDLPRSALLVSLRLCLYFRLLSLPLTQCGYATTPRQV